MTVTLEAQKRTQFGRAIKAIRKQGLIPAELYGHGVENIHLAVPVREFAKAYNEAGESTMIDLNIAGDVRKVMIHSVVEHPVTSDVVAIDFYQVNLNEEIIVDVPLIFTGEAPGIKEKGGVLVKSLTEVEVEALPADLPHDLTIDISRLVDIGSTIYAKDIVMPKGVKLETNPEVAVISVAEKLSEAEDMAESEAADLSEISAEGEKKEEAAAEDGAGPAKEPAKEASGK